MMARAWELLETLDLAPHPEGGFYRRTYLSPHTLPPECLPPGFEGSRHLASAIVYLLMGHQKSVLHRIKSDELWHFHEGSPLIVYSIDIHGNLEEQKLGSNPGLGESYQVLVPAGRWFGAMVQQRDGFSLAGCTVFPGFDFQDFELGNRESLMAMYPQHRTLIRRLTH
ncbi:MAG: cupin domain-containing protein [Deltaproteobacteria bacterium]|nr:cupin domain-containing protein [Deltaproteobacteria bacterium]